MLWLKDSEFEDWRKRVETVSEVEQHASELGKLTLKSTPVADIVPVQYDTLWGECRGWNTVATKPVALDHTLTWTWGTLTGKQTADSTNRRRRRATSTERTSASTERRQAFSCALCRHARVGPDGVSAPPASAHSSACTPAAGQFRQTYPWISARAARGSVRERTERKKWEEEDEGGGKKKKRKLWWEKTQDGGLDEEQRKDGEQQRGTTN